jgi:hypothetical protein
MQIASFLLDVAFFFVIEAQHKKAIDKGNEIVGALSRRSTFL